MSFMSGHPTITLLGEELINQIAAGEVVERPASVVKELLENCLDAHAKKINILLLGGGLREITIVDDGVGMNEADLALCLLRHATSKIQKAKDLEAIGTFGFRGEALASIAAVSKLEIRSRTKDADSGYVIRSNFGKAEPIQPEASPTGTTVSIKDIFSLLPARKKFLKSESTEFSHCARIVREIALGHPETSFHLFHQGRAISNYVATARATRFNEIFKAPWKPIHLREGTEEFALEAFLSPANWLEDKGELFLFINGRPVRNRPLLTAVRQSYREAMGPHHDPSGVLFLDLNLDWVDVNVHPQKWEVRCLRQDRLYQWLLATLRKRLVQTQSVREVKVTPPIKPAVEPAVDPAVEMVKREEIALPAFTYSPPISATRQEIPVQTTLLTQQMKEESLRFLGQVKASYLVCEDEEGLLLVDQHALQEKLFFERIKEKGAPEVQQFLVPKIIRLTPDLTAQIEKYQPTFEKMGFEVQVFGDGDIAVKSAPALLEETQIELVIRETLRLEWGEDLSATTPTDLLVPLFATQACHSAIRANKRVSDFEARALLANVDDIKQGWTCPHGRPILFRITFDSIAKYFERT